MKQMTLIPESPASERPRTARPGRDALQERLAERVAPKPESVPEPDEPDDPQTILRALIADLEEAIEIGRQMDDDLMGMMRRIVPAEEGAA